MASPLPSESSLEEGEVGDGERARETSSKKSSRRSASPPADKDHKHKHHRHKHHHRRKHRHHKHRRHHHRSRSRSPGTRRSPVDEHGDRHNPSTVRSKSPVDSFAGSRGPATMPASDVPRNGGDDAQKRRFRSDSNAEPHRHAKRQRRESDDRGSGRTASDGAAGAQSPTRSGARVDADLGRTTMNDRETVHTSATSASRTPEHRHAPSGISDRIAQSSTSAAVGWSRGEGGRTDLERGERKDSRHHSDRSRSAGERDVRGKHSRSRSRSKPSGRGESGTRVSAGPGMSRDSGREMDRGGDRYWDRGRDRSRASGTSQGRRDRKMSTGSRRGRDDDWDHGRDRGGRNWVSESRRDRSGVGERDGRTSSAGRDRGEGEGSNSPDRRHGARGNGGSDVESLHEYQGRVERLMEELDEDVQAKRIAERRKRRAELLARIKSESNTKAGSGGEGKPAEASGVVGRGERGTMDPETTQPSVSTATNAATGSVTALSGPGKHPLAAPAPHASHSIGAGMISNAFMSTGGRITGLSSPSQLVKRSMSLVDMFSESDTLDEETLDGINPALAPGLQASINRGTAETLVDNWDDSDGYYMCRTGELLDRRYTIHSTIGRGVFSSVIRATDAKRRDEQVAIKVIRNNDTMYKFGLKEQAILQQIVESDADNRRHCIRLLNSFEHRNHLCLVFEHMEMDLREVLKKYGKEVGISINACRMYAKQLLVALQLLERLKIIHGDFKPDNIVVSARKNYVKLCDFGSAAHEGDMAADEITPYLVSRFYRPPEVILGLTPYTGHMDMWSLGCTVYELYTGRILFKGRSNNEMLGMFQELRGPFPAKMLKKSIFAGQHFDLSDGTFLQKVKDPVTEETRTKRQRFMKPSRDLSPELLAPGQKIGLSSDEEKQLANMKDLLLNDDDPPEHQHVHAQFGGQDAYARPVAPNQATGSVAASICQRHYHQSLSECVWEQALCVRYNAGLSSCAPPRTEGSVSSTVVAIHSKHRCICDVPFLSVQAARSVPGVPHDSRGHMDASTLTNEKPTSPPGGAHTCRATHARIVNPSPGAGAGTSRHTRRSDHRSHGP